MTLDQVANLVALVVVNVCGYAALAPRLRRVEDKLDTKADRADVLKLQKRVATIEDSAA